MHAEVFLATTAVVGLLWLDEYPVPALPLLGIATAQMPLFGVACGVAGIAAIHRHRSDRRVWAAGAVSIAIAGLHPAYYLWHIGRLSPLKDVVSLNVPGIHLLMTPLLDPNVGMAWYAPALACLTIVGLVGACRSRPPACLIAAGAGLITIMVAAAQTPNVNHGGKPGPSRHGLWCLLPMTPFAVHAAGRLTRRGRLVLGGAALCTLIFSAQVLHPRNEEGGPTTPLAMLIWTHAPWLDNPVPESFSERVAGGDGWAPVPSATPNCEKALLVGDGQNVRWPMQCTPVPVPGECALLDAYCYWNDGAIARAPTSAGSARSKRRSGRPCQPSGADRAAWSDDLLNPMTRGTDPLAHHHRLTYTHWTL